MSKQEAQAAYRAAWIQRCLASSLDQQKDAERAMDAVQGRCVDNGGPGPEWEAFIDTLPGYREHWAGLRAECEAMFAEMFGDELKL